VEKSLKDKLKLISKRKMNSSKREKVLSILKSLQIQESEPVLKAWLEKLDKRAHRRYLDAPRKMDDEFRAIFNEKEMLFDVVLQALQDRYLKYIQILDELLSKSDPSREDINLLRNNVPKNLLTRNYFFSKLTEISWLKPLRSAEFFKMQPQPVINEGTGLIATFAWPESQYLSLVSRFEPAEVLDIFLHDVPYIENVWVLEDFIDAAIQMPPELSCCMIDRIIEWSLLMYPLYLPKKFSTLIIHLAKCGKIGYALRLAEELLEIMPDSHNNSDSPNVGEYQLPPEPQSRFDSYDFNDILQEIFPEIVEIAGVKALDLLCNMLESAILLSQRGPDEGIKDISYSVFWRPHIDRPSSRETLKDILLDAVISAVNQIAEKDESQVSTLVQFMDDRPYSLFKRIAMHIMIHYPRTTHDLIATYLNKLDLLNDIGIVNECTFLLKENFRTLNSDQQEIILKWINDGPDLDMYKDSREKLHGTRPTEKDALAYRKRWQRDRLALIEMDLPISSKNFYDDLVEEMGEPRSLEIDSYEAYGRMGSTSPIGTKELKEMTTQDIIKFLKSWKATDDFFGPSNEGMYSVLKEIIAEEPDRFAKDAVEFQSLDPIYIRALILGLRDAIELDRVFDWSLVIRLCREIISEYVAFEGAIADATYDSDLKSTCHYIAELISIGLENRKGVIPFHFRSDVWSLIEILSEDSDPTSERETQNIDSGSSRNLADFCIKTIRGESIIAVIKYGSWVRTYLEKTPDILERSAIGFDMIPEARKALERHLDFSVDSSLSIRAIYGLYFPVLVYLDNNWARNNIDSIFPLEESKRSLFEAAWGTYLVFCRPERKIVKMLKGQYSIAVERLKLITEDSGQFLNQYEHVECNLAEHLMILYWMGELELDEPDGLILRFWNNAPESLREYALQFMGFSLKHTEGNISAQVLERFKRIWEFRYGIVSKSNGISNELRSFSWWFLSNKLDDAWKLSQFEKALGLISDFRLDLLVVKKLAEISSEMPRESIKCLDLIIRKIKNKSRIHLWRKSAEVIIKNALDSEDVETRTVAENLINYLCSIRYLEFGYLLKAD
jgi:hypothetical protein